MSFLGSFPSIRVFFNAFLLPGGGGSLGFHLALMTSGEWREKQSTCQPALLVLLTVPIILFPFIDAGGVGAQVCTGSC